MHSDHMLDRVLTIKGVRLSSVKDWNTASDHKVYKQIEVSIYIGISQILFQTGVKQAR